MREAASDLVTLSEGMMYEPRADGQSPITRPSIHLVVANHSANVLRGGTCDGARRRADGPGPGEWRHVLACVTGHSMPSEAIGYKCP